MEIKFNYAGMDFDAEVSIIPSLPATKRAPAEGGEINFESLNCEGKDAIFLLDSEFSFMIEDAAYKAACKEDGL